MATELGKLGVWAGIDSDTAPQAAEFCNELEEWGYGALWIPEAVGRDPFAIIGYLAAKTERLVFATGIANLYARDPMAMNAARKTLSELAPGRFVLGLGVSHGHLVAGVRGHTYGKPLTAMRNYLEAMEKALFMGVQPSEEAPIVLAALGPKMLGLAAEKVRGAHPYFVPPEHTASAREILGPDAWLCPEQMVILETDATKAREVARANMKIYLGLPNYQNNLLHFGFSAEDFANGGSDRVIDAICVWGDEKTIWDRVQAHYDAGADHVCIQAFRPDGKAGTDMRVLEAFAPAKQ